MTGKDPYFQNASQFVFKLSPQSPALNAGSNLYSLGVVTDIESRSRPRTGQFDLGAYESSGTIVAPAFPVAPSELNVQ